MKIVDTHAHLCDPSFDHDLPEILEKAEKTGVVAIISVSEDLEDAKKNLKLSDIFPTILPAAGLYPSCLDVEEAEEMIGFIRDQKDRLVAIGEVGLDFWLVKDDEKREIQKEIFKRFIKLSGELGLPLNVHSRSAGRYGISLLIENGAEKVQMHAFDGKASTALPGVDAGFFFSIPPSVVRSRQKQKLVKRLPLSCLLIETDSPVLGKNPNERNEPANAVLAIRAIAEIKDVSPEEVAERTYENTIRLYGNLGRSA